MKSLNFTSFTKGNIFRTRGPNLKIDSINLFLIYSYIVTYYLLTTLILNEFQNVLFQWILLLM